MLFVLLSTLQLSVGVVFSLNYSGANPHNGRVRINVGTLCTTEYHCLPATKYTRHDATKMTALILFFLLEVLLINEN